MGASLRCLCLGRGVGCVSWTLRETVSSPRCALRSDMPAQIRKCRPASADTHFGACCATKTPRRGARGRSKQACGRGARPLDRVGLETDRLRPARCENRCTEQRQFFGDPILARVWRAHRFVEGLLDSSLASLKFLRSTSRRSTSGEYQPRALSVQPRKVCTRHMSLQDPRPKRPRHVAGQSQHAAHQLSPWLTPLVLEWLSTLCGLSATRRASNAWRL